MAFPRALQPQAQWVIWGPRGQTRAVSHRAPEPSPQLVHWLGSVLESQQPTSPWSPPPALMVSSSLHGSQSRGPALIWVYWGARGPTGSWVPGSLSDVTWTVSGDLALRVPPAEIQLSWGLGTVGGPRLDTGQMLLSRVTGLQRSFHLLANPGPQRGRDEPWDLALSRQNGG